jgi:branched-chain amino acid transport system permease protein
MLLALDFSQLVQQTIAGLAAGGIYAILALALVLIHRATGVINFAQGEMAMFSTYIAWSLLYTYDLPYLVAFVLTLAISFLGGAGIYATVIKPLSRAGDLAVVIATIALFVLINGLAGWLWSPELRFITSPFPNGTWTVGDVVISKQDLCVFGVSIACVVVVFLIFRFTRTGLLMRASALRPATSRLLGIRVALMLAIGWGLAAALGAVAGLMAVPSLGLEPPFMQVIIVYAFAAAVLGGLDSPVGAVVGAYALGVGMSLLQTYVGEVSRYQELKLPIALGLLLLVLLFKPTGLFGRTVTRRV